MKVPYTHTILSYPPRERRWKKVAKTALKAVAWGVLWLIVVALLFTVFLTAGNWENISYYLNK